MSARTRAVLIGCAIAVATALAGFAGVATVAGAFWYFSQDLPTLETLRNYRPPTVTEVYDAEGALLGEIYEKRRYVVEYEQFPEHLQNAFLAAEDANFWSHPGIDLMGIFRAVVWNTLQGRKAQGASTITQQVARNFLLTSEKKISRKIREMILAGRITRAGVLVPEMLADDDRVVPEVLDAMVGRNVRYRRSEVILSGT